MRPVGYFIRLPAQQLPKIHEFNKKFSGKFLAFEHTRQFMSSNNSNASDYGAGYLEISEKGFGFLRTAANHFHPKPTDIFVTPDTIKRNFLREGSLVAGPTQPPHRGTSPQLKSVEKVNDMPFEDYTKGSVSRISPALIRLKNTSSKPARI